MNSINSSECSLSGIEKYTQFQLSPAYKTIGRILFGLCFIALFVNAFTVNNLVIREFIKYGILVGLLIISISKEEIEDEFIIHLRMQSYAFAFIGGILLALSRPIANYVVDLLLQQDTGIWQQNGDWVTLWILLFSQVAIFEMLKKRSS